MKRATEAARETALRHIASNVQAVRTVDALHRAGIKCLMLKGVGHDLWLYPDDARPASRDVDLLVAPGELGGALATMARLGFVRQPGPLGPEPPGAHNVLMPSGGSGVPVELHTSFHFLDAPSERVWELLSADAESIEVGGTRIEIPSVPVRALLLPLHVASHGRAGDWAIEDLRRAAARLRLEDWDQAARLAAELGASAAFAAGLRLIPAGAEIADALGLTDPAEPALALSLQSASLPARRMLNYAGGTSRAALTRLLRSQLIPPRDQMRTWYPLARRGRWGLVAAHVVRLARLMRQSARLAADWRQARAALGDGSGRDRRHDSTLPPP